MIWYDFGPIRTSGSIVSTQTLHSLTETMKGPGPFGLPSIIVVVLSGLMVKVRVRRATLYWVKFRLWQFLVKMGLDFREIDLWDHHFRRVSEPIVAHFWTKNFLNIFSRWRSLSPAWFLANSPLFVVPLAAQRWGSSLGQWTLTCHELCAQ